MKKTICLLALCALVPAAWAQQPAANEPLRLSLRDAVVRAVENNLDVRVAKINPLIDEQDVLVAESAFDPTIDGSVSYRTNDVDYTNSSSTSTNGSIGFSDPLQWGGAWGAFVDYAYNRSVGDRFLQDPVTGEPIRVVGGNLAADASLRLQYTQSLLRNFGVTINRTQIEQAMATQKISESQFRQRVEQTIESVEQSYWSLVGARRQYDVAMASLDLAKDFLRQTKIRVEVGTLPPIEITTAEAEVADREERVILAEKLIRDAEDQVRALLRFEPASPDWERGIFTTDEPGFAPVSVDVEKAVATALERRPEIQQAQLAIRRQELETRYRSNQTRPDLRVAGFVELGGNAYDNDDLVDPADPDSWRYQGKYEPFTEIPSGDNPGWGASAFIAYPIFNRAAKADFTRSRLAEEQAKLNLEAAQQAIRVEVREAARALEAAAKRVATTRVNVVLQRKKLDAEQKRYENGLSTAFQVLTFQTDLRDAESREITAVVDYNRALATLGRVQGTLLDERGIEM